MDGTDFVTLAHHGVPTEYCPRCRGIWLPAGSLQQIIEAAVDEIEGFPTTVHRDRNTPVPGLITTADIRR
jgi:Zn-finger nucleic acid-binding protein